MLDMGTLRSRRLLLGLTLGALLLPVAGRAQEREVVSKQVSVGRSEAALRVEFSSGAPLDISLHDGSVFIDGEVAGAFQAGDALDAAWRTLLGDAVRLDDGQLAEALRDWSPPSDLKGDRLELADEIDGALERALTVEEAPPAADAPKVDVSVGGAGDGALVRALLGQANRLSTLEEALKGVGSNLKLHVGEDVAVESGETVEGTLVVVQGDARIDGEVNGSVVVVDGTLELSNGSRIRGDVRLADANLRRSGGTVDGEVVNVDRRERDLEREIRDQVRDEMRSELRNEIRDASRSRAGSGGSFFSPFRALLRALGGVIENLVAVLVLGLVGMGVVAFAPRNLDTVAETARRSPGRAAMVGVAGAFLLVPVWLLGAVALAVSIVGIPVMLLWLPLFPLAAVAAALLGYLAVARNAGEWLSESGYRYTDWIRKSNPVYTMFAGVLALALFFIAANLLRVVPFFGFFRGLLTFAGVVCGVVAMLIGFGAVLLTRAGRRQEHEPVDFDEAWKRAVDVDVEVEVETSARTDASAAGEGGGDGGGDAGGDAGGKDA
jgi:hypothetical protein